MKSEYLMLRKGDLNCQLHVNPELEIVYVKQGEVLVKGAGKGYAVHTGEAVIIPPYSLHSFECDTNVRATVFMFSYSIAEDFHKKYTAKQLDGKKIFIEEELASFVEYGINKMDYENNDCIIKSIFYAFTAAMLRDNKIEQQKNRGDFGVEQIVEYVFFNLSEELSLVQLASVFGINKNTLGSLFRDTIGIKFKSFVNNIRLEKAKLMLEKGDMTVTEIAFECGFGSVRSMNRIFLKQLGCSPTEYRKNVFMSENKSFLS